MPSDLALMQLHTAALHTLDSRHRLLRGRDPFRTGGEPAPRFFMGRTLEGNVWHLRHDLPDALARRLAGLASGEPVCPEPEQLEAPPAAAPVIRRLLAGQGGPAEDHGGPAFYAPQTWTVPAAAVETALVQEGDESLLDGDLAALELRPFLPLIQPCVVALQRGRAVAACFSSRTTDQAMEAGLETLPPWRRRGYGLAAAARWVAEVRRSGRQPLYSTSWGNLASRGLARRLGLALYAGTWSVT